MKKLHIATIILFFAVLLIPIVTFEWGNSVVSEIDNRMLTENPFGQNLGVSDTIKQLDPYVKDRIGLRTGMIRAYTRLSDSIFGEMVHPTYTYGQDGYVFFRATGGGPHMGEYHRQFAAMVAEIQRYCDERNIPFVFVFNPAKTSVLSDKLAEGINYNNGWVEEFLKLLDEYGVRYVDNTVILKEKTSAGEAVFNQQYNAGHWNDLGAFYGINAVLEQLQSDFPNLHVNSKDDFEITQKLNTTLMVSEFPINEYEPIFTAKEAFLDISSELCGEVQMDEQYKTFAYRVNEAQKKQGAPKALVFQGSYINGMGYKFLANSFGEYIAVHDYQNVLNMPYYFNIFQPDCVIFEVAEYVFSDSYFSREGIKNFRLNSSLDKYEKLPRTEKKAAELSVSTEKGHALTQITVEDLPQDTLSAYLIMNGVTYDFLSRDDGSWSLSILNENCCTDGMEIIAVDTSESVYTCYKWEA